MHYRRRGGKTNTLAGENECSRIGLLKVRGPGAQTPGSDRLRLERCNKFKGLGKLGAIISTTTVSYTHLTLPTNREV